MNLNEEIGCLRHCEMLFCGMHSLKLRVRNLKISDPKRKLVTSIPTIHFEVYEFQGG